MAKVKTNPTLDEGEEKTPKSLTIDIDTSEEDMLKYQEKGYILFFDTKIGRFKKLTPEQVKKLDQNNKVRYFVAVGEHQNLLEESDDPFSGLDLKVDKMAYSATEALEVFGKDPNFHYAWKSPEKLQRAQREGFVPAKEANLKTAVGSGTEVRKIGAYGKDELVLCKMPKELHERKVREKLQMNKELEGAGIRQGIEEISKAGKVYIPPESGDDDLRFSHANPERATR